MKYIGIVIVFYLLRHGCYSLNGDKLDLQMKVNSTSEKKGWHIKLDIYFARPLPPVIKKPLGGDLKLKCEAIMNFTKVEKYTKNKEGTETFTKESPPEHIQQTLMKNVKFYWLKDHSHISLESNRTENFTKIDMINGTIGSYLHIKYLTTSDEGNYTCVIKQNYEKYQTTSLKVLNSIDYIDKTNLASSPVYSKNDSVLIIKGATEVLEDPKFQNINEMDATKYSTMPHKLEYICQEYHGTVCAQLLKSQFVYIPYNITQAALEEKLVMAIQVTKYSNDISSQCEGYALPSLCYSTFPICRDPFSTNQFFLEKVKQVMVYLSNTTKSPNTTDLPKINLNNISQQQLSNIIIHLSENGTIHNLKYRFNSTVLRRVCKQDCEILEHELCQTEYAIAKRHPHIGQQLTLEDCQDLPEHDPDCLKIGIGSVIASDDECYWENGRSYLGRVNITNKGMACVEWSKQLHVKVSEYPELAGRHSYCRNPGGIESQPWCFVEKDGKTEVQICDIDKCALKIWMYIVVILVLLTVSIIAFVICICYRNKAKGSAATIRDINLPNADKNIYGNSRLNSPIEMNELLTNQNITNQPHLTRNTRGNGLLRIPQYSLSQIKFLEELGEGAFGKVYKGALKKNGETQYVAVKALKENASAKTQADFRREIDLISELTHENIVCIVGVALREEPLCMLFEFMARGDLHEFLMGRAPPSGKGLPPMRLLNIANNIASGMQYLASHHYVHRDLAARNCLVSDDFIVKISDFGLSRDIYSSDYYRVQSKSLLPVRWMPPESILYGKFTTESDIWSYGVVLWEIYSYGLQPYYGYSNQEVIAMVRGGELLAMPAACPPIMYALMRDCWKHTPQRRPTFEEIVNRIQEWIQVGGCPETELGNNVCSHRSAGSSRDLQEKVPLLPPHCSSSNGSLATGSLKKFNTVGSSKITDDTRSTTSEMPPLVPKTKKHSSGSLIDTEKVGTRETVVRIPSTQFGNEI